MVGSSIPQSLPGSAARGEVGREEMYEAVWGGRLPLTDSYGRRKKYSPAAAPALAHVSCSGYPPEIRTKYNSQFGPTKNVASIDTTNPNCVTNLNLTYFRKDVF